MSTTPNLQVDLGLANLLEPLVQERQALKELVANTEERIDQITAAIKARMTEAGVTTLEAGDYKVTLSPNSRSTLDKTELINQGVSLAQIEAATRLQVFDPKLDVRQAKGRK